MAWFFLLYLWPYLYSAEEMELLNWTGYGAKFELNGPIPYFFLAASFAASIGLLLFKRWGRTTFVLLICVSVLSTPAWGITVIPALDEGIGYIVALAHGAIIAMAYLTTLGSEFR